MTTKCEQVLVVPDVHGRGFWKKPFEELVDKVDTVVFLGDYLDPYEYENISRKEAFKNFDEVIAMKQAYPEKVKLLLGNHDMHYIVPEMPQSTRYDEAFAYLLKERYANAEGAFQLAYACEINLQPYLFTHAGVDLNWYKAHEQEIGELTDESLNALYTPEYCSEALQDVGFIRGGFTEYGSPVWSDIRDLLEAERCGETIKTYYQVFGHTQLDDPVISDTFACLDCRRAFLLDSNGLHEAY